MTEDKSIIDWIHPSDGPIVARAKAVPIALALIAAAPMLMGAVGLIFVVVMALVGIAMPIAGLWALISPHSLRLYRLRKEQKEE